MFAASIIPETGDLFNIEFYQIGKRYETIIFGGCSHVGSGAGPAARHGGSDRVPCQMAKQNFLDI